MTLPILHLYRRLRIFLNHNLKNSSALTILKKLNVRGDISGLIMRLSGGNQQKVLFARSIMQKPILLLLDEPTKGIDIGAKIEIYDLIKSLVKSENIGVILVSSEEEEILSITDTVMIFRNGTSSGIKNKTSELDIANLRLLALQGKN
jgi:ABC-type sugar transport system ATPase subunit